MDKKQQKPNGPRARAVKSRNQNRPKGPIKRKQNDGLKQDGYMASAPVSRTRFVKTSAPRMMSLRNGDCIVTHREYIQDITAFTGSPSTFQSTSFALNPGQVATFPWLSNVARNFESYRFRKLHFRYETEAPSSLGGTLVMSVDYDSTDPAPLTKQQAMAYRNAVRSAPWEPCCHTSMREDLSKLKSMFVRPGAQPANTDIKLYDVGNLFVCTQNVTTASAVCGELYVEYEVELLTPIWENSFGVSGVLEALINTPGQGAAAPWGTAPLTGLGSIQLSNPGNTVVSVAGLVVGQEYSIGTFVTGTVMSGWVVTASAGATGRRGSVVMDFNAGATNGMNVQTIIASATSCIITYSAITATTVTQADLFIALVPLI